MIKNEITFVNTVWEQVNEEKARRKAEGEHLGGSLEKLKEFQKQGSMGFLKKLRDNLVYIAFELEPAIDDLMLEFMNNDKAKYAHEHSTLAKFYKQVLESDQAKF